LFIITIIFINIIRYRSCKLLYGFVDILTCCSL